MVPVSEHEAVRDLLRRRGVCLHASVIADLATRAEVEQLRADAERWKEAWKARGRRINGTGEFDDEGPWAPPEETARLVGRINELEAEVERLHWETRQRREAEQRRRPSARFERWRMRWFPYRWYAYEDGNLRVTNENIMTAWTRRGWKWRGREFMVRTNEAPR